MYLYREHQISLKAYKVLAKCQGDLRTAYVRCVSEKLSQTSGMIYPHQNNKEIYIDTLPPPVLSFRRAVQQSVDFSPLNFFFVCGHLKPQLYSSAINNADRHFTDAFSMLVKL
jgi:hypothetical protein